MEYFAGLDVSMEETHVCVLDRDGVVTHQAKVASTPADIAQELKKAPACLGRSRGGLRSQDPRAGGCRGPSRGAQDHGRPGA